jgi:CheY-like chemotaxis protein
VTGEQPIQNTVYLTGVGPGETQHVRDDFRAYPFPGWHLEVLDPGVPPPLNLLAGQAILVIGCGVGGAPGHAEAMWLLRLFACGCPWLAVADSADRPARELCEAAGAVAYLTRPFTPAKLRDLIWRFAVPHAGKTPVVPLTCERMLRYFAVLGADVLLKFSADAGRTGFLALTGGRPTHAKVLDGAEGAAALREILNWGKGRVLGQPLPASLPSNLPDNPEAWVHLLRATPTAPHVPQRPVPGGREACDRVVRDLPDVLACALVDLRSGRQAAGPSPGVLRKDTDPDFVSAAADLFRSPICPADPLEPVEQPAEVVALGRDGWWAATRLGGGAFALVLRAAGQGHLGLARQVFAAAAEELERRSGMVVEDETTRDEDPRADLNLAHATGNMTEM